MPQPMSAAGHDYSVPALVRPRAVDVALALLGTTLSVAAIWFVLLPAIREKPPTLQTCEVVVLANGTTRCDNGETLANVVNRQP
jgi:hypothetical protein